MMRCFDCANRSEGFNKERTRYCDWCSETGQGIDLDELHEDCPNFEEWVDDCEGAP